jgi:PST family polysaccharide transporter
MPEHRTRIIHNFISLSFVQALSILFPLITFPYLLRVLGVEGFGLFTLIQTVLMYADLLVSFGFGLTATQHIARNLSNEERTQNVISAVFIIKGILFAISMIGFFLMAIFIPFLRENIWYILMASLYVMGNIFFPDWYFQGVQKMRSMTVVALLSKIISLLLILILVHSKNDILFAIFALAAGNFIAGLVGFYLLSRTVTLKLKNPGKRFLYSIFRESAVVFTSIMLVPLYSSVNLFILRAFSNPLMVGYYAIAEKIYSALAMLTNIANRTFYPHLSQLYAKSKDAYRKNVRSIVGIFLAGFSILSVIIFFTAPWIVQLVSGLHQDSEIAYAIQLLSIMCIGLFFSPYVSFFFQLLVIQGQRKSAFKNIAAVVVVNLVCGILLTYLFSGKGMAVNLCINTFLLALINYISFSRKHPELEHRPA